MSRTVRLIIDRISGALPGDPSLLEHEQLFVSSAEVGWCLLSRLGPTDGRITVVSDGFARFLDFPALLGPLIEAAGRLWSDEVLRRIADAVVRAWAPSPADTRRNSLTKLAVHVTRRQAESVLPVAIESATGGAREMLEFWRDVALKRPTEEN